MGTDWIEFCLFQIPFSHWIIITSVKTACICEHTYTFLFSLSFLCLRFSLFYHIRVTFIDPLFEKKHAPFFILILEG